MSRLRNRFFAAVGTAGIVVILLLLCWSVWIMVEIVLSNSVDRLYGS